MNRTCSIEGCNRIVYKRDMCRGHFRYGVLHDCGPVWYFPTASLRSVLRNERIKRDETWALLCERTGLKPAVVNHILTNSSVGWDIVDEVCIALDLHPVLVYPEWIRTLDLSSYLERRQYAKRVAEAIA